jgi:hypothetical protein
MQMFRIDAADIAELDMPVAVHGSFSDAETMAADGLFELIVGVVELIYELAPG